MTAVKNKPIPPWRSTTVTIGLLVAIAVAVASVLVAWQSFGSTLKTNINQAIKQHDTCSQAHQDIRKQAVTPRQLDKLGHRVDALTREMRAFRKALMADRKK